MTVCELADSFTCHELFSLQRIKKQNLWERAYVAKRKTNTAIDKHRIDKFDLSIAMLYGINLLQNCPMNDEYYYSTVKNDNNA